MSKTVPITGASSGFGKLAAKNFQSEGWNVVATMRLPDKEQELAHPQSCRFGFRNARGQDGGWTPPGFHRSI